MSNCKTQSLPALSAGTRSSPSKHTESIAERPGFSLSGDPWSTIVQDSPVTPASRRHPDGQKERAQTAQRQHDAHPQRKGRPKRSPTRHRRGSTLTVDTVTKPVLHPFFVAERAPRRMGPVSVLLRFRRIHDALTTPGLFPLRSGGNPRSSNIAAEVAA